MYLKQIPRKKIFIGVYVLFALVTSVITAMDGGDFDHSLYAAQKLSDHQNIYTDPFLDGMKYYYSVFYALVLIPFSANYFVTELLWSLLSYFLLYRIFKLITGYFNFPETDTKSFTVWLLFTTALSIQFVLYNVSMIQVTIFLLWAIIESLDLLFKGKNILSGIILGLVINIKIMPVLLLPYLFYRGYFKALGASILTFIVLLFLPSLFIGNDFNFFLLSEWWSLINPANKEHLFETGIGTHSLVALIPVYLMETTGEMDYSRNILNLSSQTVEIIINISRLLILSLSLFYFKSLPFKKEKNKLKYFREISFFIMIVPLLLPHQNKYDFLLVAPMISYLVYFFIAYQNQKTSIYYVVLFTFCICALFYSPLYGSDVIGNFLFRFTQHYRLLTVATLLLIPISLFCRPEKLSASPFK